MRTIVLSLAALMLFRPSGAAADQTVNAKLLLSKMVRYPGTSPLAMLRYSALHGDEQTRQQIAREVLNAMMKYNPSLVLDFGHNYYRLVFLVSQPDGETALFQTLVHEPMPAGNILEGLRGASQPLLTIFVADDRSTSIHTAATVTQEANPLAADFASFVSTTLAKVALPAGIGIRRLTAPEPPECGDCVDVAVSESALELPFARGKVSVTDTITIDDQKGYIGTRMKMIAADVAEDPSTAQCVKIAVARFEDVPASAMEDPSCASKELQVPAKCLETIRTDLRAAFNDASAACADPVLRTTAVRLLGAITADAKAITGKTDYANVPRSHVTLGLATAFLVSARQSDPRVSVQNGKIAPNPLTRSLSFAVVNWFPRGFNPKSPVLTSSERYRLFAGVAFAPYFGPAAGGAIALNQNLAINVGAALLLIDVAKAGETIGAAPVAAEPFKVGMAVGWFAGFSYNMK